MKWKILFVLLFFSYFNDLIKLFNAFSFVNLLLFIMGTIDIIGLFSFTFDKYLFHRKFWFYYFVFSILFITITSLLNLNNLYSFISFYINNRSLFLGFLIAQFIKIFGLVIYLFVFYSLSQGKTNKDY
jgi:hypothetical protein